jgi:Zn-dependent protease
VYGLYIESDEAVQIVICVFSISLALAIVFASPEGMLGYPGEFLLFLAPLIVTVGSGFIMHEMAHKLVAIYYGGRAKFKMWVQGLVFMLATSFLGVLFAAPGAVYIHMQGIRPRENGLISLAGPLLNVALVGFFIVLDEFAPIRQFFTFLIIHGRELAGFGIYGGILSVWKFGAAMNIMLALFNMIPAFPLDGSKVFAWSRLVWFSVIIFLLAIGAVVISPGIVIGWAIMLLLFAVLSKLLFG